MAKDKDKYLFNTFIILICVTFVFIMILANFGLKNNDGAVCQRVNIDNFQNKNLVETSYILDSSDDYFLTNINFLDDDVLYYEVCLRAEVKTTDHLKINLINSKHEVLSNFYMVNGNNTKCVFLNASNIVPNEYLGVSCSNCAVPDDEITLLEQGGAVDVPIIYFDSPITEIYTEDNPIYLTVDKLTDCNKNIREFTFYYFTILIMIGIMLLVIIGYDAFYERLKDW